MSKEQTRLWGLLWNLFAVICLFTFLVTHLPNESTLPSSFHGVPSQQAITLLSLYLPTLKLMCSNIAFPLLLTRLHTHEYVYFVMRTLLEMYPPKESLLIWVALYIVDWKSWGTHVLFLSRTLFRPSFPISDFLLCIDVMNDISFLVFALRL